jgi:hypothetical protein
MHDLGGNSLGQRCGGQSGEGCAEQEAYPHSHVSLPVLGRYLRRAMDPFIARQYHIIL